MNYDLQTVRNAFKGEIKFKNDFAYTSLYGNLDSDLLGVGNSGLFYNQGVNPLITLRTIEALMPLVSDMEVAAWSGTTTYGIDDCVLVSSVYYRSIVGSNLNNNVADIDYWEVTTLMSIWIRHKINSVFDTVLSKSLFANNLFDHIRMYQHSDSDNVIANESKYVGYEIRPRDSEYLRLIINRIATQFSATQTSLNLYLYKQNTLVQTIALSSLVAKELAFTNITDYEISGEGRWFLFYDQDDLSGQAYNYSVSPNYPNVEILPFAVDNTTTDFVNDVGAYTYNSYGLGLDMSVYADITNFILDNKQAFAPAIHAQWQYDILELFLVNPEVQKGSSLVNIRENREFILGELKSETQFSLASKLRNAYKTLIKSLDMGTVALPRTNDNTITYESYG